MLKKPTTRLALLTALTMAQGVWAQTDVSPPGLPNGEGTATQAGLLQEAPRDRQKELRLREYHEHLVKEKQQQTDAMRRDTAELKEVQKKIKASASWIDDNLVERLPEMSSQAVKLRVELAGLKARQAAVEQALEEQAKGAVREVDKDEVTAQLQQLVKLKEEALVQGKEELTGGVISPSQWRDMEASLIDVRVKLAERREAVVGRNITPAMIRLRDQLVELTVSGSETQAKLDAIQQLAERAKLFNREVELSNSIRFYEDSLKRLETEAAQLAVDHPAATQPGR